jgi:hypothetical protein
MPQGCPGAGARGPKLIEATDAVLRLSAACGGGSDPGRPRVEAVPGAVGDGPEDVGVVQELASQVRTIRPAGSWSAPAGPRTAAASAARPATRAPVSAGAQGRRGAKAELLGSGADGSPFATRPARRRIGSRAGWPPPRARPGWFVMSGQTPRQRLVVEGGATDIVEGGGEAGVAWRREPTGRWCRPLGAPAGWRVGWSVWPRGGAVVEGCSSLRCSCTGAGAGGPVPARAGRVDLESAGRPGQGLGPEPAVGGGHRGLPGHGPAPRHQTLLRP